MPKLTSFFITHQWLRELKRNGQRTLVAVDFRIPSSEEVWVGHFGNPHVLTEVGRAIGVMRAQEDAPGYELVVPRAISSTEIIRVRRLSQTVGWRYYPKAKGKKPCPCDFCQRGAIKGRRIRARYPE